MTRPLTIAADSALLGNLARDSRSGNPHLRAEAARVEKAMEEAGAVFLVSAHHIEELLSHGNDNVVTHRVAWLQARSILATIRCYAGPVPGSVCDLLVSELLVAAEAANACASTIRDRALAARAIDFQTGAALLAEYETFWPVLRGEYRARAERSSAIAAIVQGNIPNVGNRRLKEFLGGSVRGPSEMAARIASIEVTLGADIAAKHDGNVSDPRALAAAFTGQIVREASFLNTASPDPVRDDLLRRGLNPDDLDPERRMVEMFDLLEFRTRVEVVAEYLPPDLPDMRNFATLDRLPSWAIERALRTYRQHRPKNPGSDLGDRHLACVAAYADLTFVDRRTHEDFMRARRREPRLAPILRRIEKSGNWTGFLRVLDRLVKGEGDSPDDPRSQRRRRG